MSCLECNGTPDDCEKCYAYQQHLQSIVEKVAKLFVPRGYCPRCLGTGSDSTRYPIAGCSLCEGSGTVPQENKS